MPAEFEPHTRTHMVWPSKLETWRDGAKPIRRAFVQILEGITQFEPVTLAVKDAKEMEEAKAMLKFEPRHPTDTSYPITFTIMDSNDSWVRDSGPSFVVREAKGAAAVGAICWEFNSWGGLCSEFELDQKVGAAIALGVPPEERGKKEVEICRPGIVMEGGSFHVDGQGTVLTTAECLLNPNRNPNLSKEQIEERLLRCLGAEKVIWIPRGLVGDHDTDGHVDNLACFIAPGKILLTWSDDPSDPQYEISREAEKAILSTLDARGRKIEVVKIPQPPRSCYTREEIDSFSIPTEIDSFSIPTEKKAFVPPSLKSINLKSLVASIQGRRVGDRLALSYANFLICNGGIVAPSFGSDPEGLGGPDFEEQAKKTDAEAERILRDCFPGRKVVMVKMGREIALGGGNIHCLTQQQPRILGS